MENPHELPAPEDPIEQVHAFARDLAYGVTQGWWTTQFSLKGEEHGELWLYYGEQTGQIYFAWSNLVTVKWQNFVPPYSLLLSFGYIQTLENTPTPSRVFLTRAALDLLKTPSAPPSVFISYKRDQSSAFALLVEARLRLVGNPNPFVDKNIVAGDGWHGRLKDTIQQSKYFVCLIGKDTLQSEWVQKEIAWAAAAGCTLISIWHGCAMDETCPAALRERHAITVTGESAREYETAISELLNALGYATY
jgi:hypothetical protein